jgi:hypothetical protein
VLNNHILCWQRAGEAVDDEMRRAVNLMASGDFVAEDTLDALLQRRQIIRALLNELTEVAAANRPEAVSDERRAD